LPSPEDGRRWRADAARAAQEPPRARDGGSGRPVQLRGATPGHERARRRGGRARGRRGCGAGTRGPGAGTQTIGLTGPIGCGQSTIAGWLAEAGAVVVNADAVARDVVERGAPAFEQVVATFGPGVLDSAGDLDRGALARIVFGDPVRLAELEAIVHPAVRPRIL